MCLHSIVVLVISTVEEMWAAGRSGPKWWRRSSPVIRSHGTSCEKQKQETLNFLHSLTVSPDYT